jgi:hypothetical protein
VSKGPGSAERFILESVAGWSFLDGHHGGPNAPWDENPPLEPGEGLPLLKLAEQYANERGIVFTRSVVESLRRAVHQLERKELVRTDYWWLPTAKAGGGRVRKMLLVGAHGDEPLLPSRMRRPLPNVNAPRGFRTQSFRTQRTTPSRLQGRPYLRDVGRCLICDAELEEEVDFAALDAGVPIGDTCYACWCERHPDHCHICGKKLRFGVTEIVPPVDNWCNDCWNWPQRTH